MMASKYKNISIDCNATILSAMRTMDSIKRKLLIVISNNKYVGLISIGDIQRAIIKDIPLTSSILTIMRNDYIVAKIGQKEEEIKELMVKLRSEFMPLLSENGELVSIYFWEDFFNIPQKEPLFQFNLPVIIMAGGEGTRLRPITYVLPKPLIPLFKKSLLEEIFDRFCAHGCDTFYISVNYKADLIEYYISQKQLPYNILYLREDIPMGTGGSLSLLKGKVDTTFFVTNCDILVEQDYSEVLRYHYDNKNDITIIAALKQYPIAYGSITSGEEGRLLEIVEKPDITIKINSGMYIFEPSVLNDIPSNEFTHITQLIENVRLKGGKVGVFPISENSWKDIGQWDEYLKHIMPSN